MRRNFWKGASISVAAYSLALLLGVMLDFRLTMYALAGLFLTWNVFCVVRAIQLGFGEARGPGALACDRESLGFALGGAVFSLVWIVVIVVLSQAV